MAQQLVGDCRGDFARSLFVLISADQQIVGELKDQLDRSHRGLAQTLKLPLPEPEANEKIVCASIGVARGNAHKSIADERKDVEHFIRGMAAHGIFLPGVRPVHTGL